MELIALFRLQEFARRFSSACVVVLALAASPGLSASLVSALLSYGTH